MLVGRWVGRLMVGGFSKTRFLLYSEKISKSKKLENFKNLQGAFTLY